MPPRNLSRFTFSLGYAEADAPDLLLLSEREPFTFREFPDNRQHSVVAGETLWTIAGRYFKEVPRPSGLWWVIADFQPEPIHDPTLRLAVGSVLVIPSVRTVLESVFSENRRLGDDG